MNFLSTNPAGRWSHYYGENFSVTDTPSLRVTHLSPDAAHHARNVLIRDNAAGLPEPLPDQALEEFQQWEGPVAARRHQEVLPAGRGDEPLQAVAVVLAAKELQLELLCRRRGAHLGAPATPAAAPGSAGVAAYEGRPPISARGIRWQKQRCPERAAP